MPIRRTRLPSLQRKLSPSDTRLTVQASATGRPACCAEQPTGTSQNRKGSRVAEQRRTASDLHLVITGAGGLIGSALLPRLAADGHRITRLTRGAAGPGEVSWDPARGVLDLQQLGRVDSVVHLAGEAIGSRWTSARKRRIQQSRALGTGLLSQALSRLQPRPEVLISASAIGIYGDRGNELLTEASAPGNPEQDFLVRVCLDWEAAAEPARQAGIRVVHPRFGLVLSPEGGALAKLLPPFRLGLGGHQGHGYQWMSWIAMDDVIGAIRHALSDRQLSGPVNVTAPGAVVNRHFTQILGRVLRRPTLLRVPAAVLQLGLGEMAQRTVLASARVQPSKLLQRGYRFEYPELEGALRHVLETETSGSFPR
jgi:uncharacterized protein